MATTFITSRPDPVVTLQISRCDRCGAAGKVTFLLASGLDLVFCTHHANVYEWAIPTGTVRIPME